MTVHVIVNGRPWAVAIEPAGPAGLVTVTVNGSSRAVDASWIDADTLSLVDGGAAHEIRFHARDGHGVMGAEIAGRVIEVSTQGGRARPSSSGSAAGTIAGGPVSVRAPMPGRVVRVLVAPGDRVVARQGVVVVEAMKMENELRTPRDGTVREISTAPGVAVEAGAVLLVIGD
jgi:biotin carboxyl carrier protein